MKLAVLLSGCPALAGPLRAAGVALLSSGDEPPEQVARMAEEAHRAGRDYAVLLARPTPALSAWAQVQLGQRRRVVFLVPPGASVPLPPAADVVALPASVDDVLSALGAKPAGGVVGSAEVAADLSVRPTQVRPGLGLFASTARPEPPRPEPLAEDWGGPVGPDATTAAEGPAEDWGGPVGPDATAAAEGPAEDWGGPVGPDATAAAEDWGGPVAPDATAAAEDWGGPVDVAGQSAGDAPVAEGAAEDWGSGAATADDGWPAAPQAPGTGNEAEGWGGPVTPGPEPEEQPDGWDEVVPVPGLVPLDELADDDWQFAVPEAAPQAPSGPEGGVLVMRQAPVAEEPWLPQPPSMAGGGQGGPPGPGPESFATDDAPRRPSPAQAPGPVSGPVSGRFATAEERHGTRPPERLVTDEVFRRQAPQSADERVAPLVVCFAGKGGVGKCLALSDTSLADPVTGLQRRLDEVVADPAAKWVLTLDDGVVRAAPIAAKVDSGILPTFRVTLRSGRHITATANHPLLLADGWRRLDCVGPGETVAVPARIPHPLAPVPMGQAEIDLLAVLMAEGGLTSRYVGFTTPDPVVVSLMESAAKSLGFFVVRNRELQYRLTCPTKPQAGERGVCQCGCGTPTALATRTSRGARRGEPFRWVRGHERLSDLTVLLRHHGIAGHTSRTKPMPDAIWRLPAEQLARFLNVFWGCDGYVTKSGIPELALANEPLLRAVQHLLLRFSVQSSIRYKRARCNGKDFDAWSLRVHAGCVAPFAEHLPLWGEKGERLRARKGAAHNPNLGGPTVTDELYEEIVSHRRGLGVDDAACLRGWRTGKTSPSMLLLNNRDGKRRTLSLTGLAAYAKAYGLEHEYGWIYSSDIYWDEVVSVEPAGEQQVWDLSVEKTHCFVANDVVVHNSTTALALAQQAAAAGLRAVVVDANRGQGDLRKYLRVGQAYLPSVVDAAVSGDPERAITSPERLVATRPSGLPSLAFGVVLAPTDAQADPALVTPDVYRSVVRAVRGAADLVVVDTQIVEAADTSGMVERFLVPELLAGAWGLGLSDTSVGVDNLLRRLYMLSARGVGPERLMVALNRVEAQSGLNQEAMVRLMEPYAAWMGAVGMDPAVATAFESGAIPASPELAALLDRVLSRVTGLGAFAPEPKGGSAKAAKTRWRWLRWR